jgi:hypothetical protein
MPLQLSSTRPDGFLEGKAASKNFRAFREKTGVVAFLQQGFAARGDSKFVFLNRYKNF